MNRLPDYRASDAEREAVIATLREQSAAGRLDLDELGERISKALAAKTRSELDALLVDLPRTPAPRPRPTNWTRHKLALSAAEVALIDAFALTIWLFNDHGSFWPGWIIFLTAFWFAFRVLREQMRATRRAEREQRQRDRWQRFLS